MIEGLKVSVKGAEVQELCLKQMKFHEGRVAFYTKQIEALRGNLTEREAEANFANKYSGPSPIDQAKDKIQEHTDKMWALEFIGGHLKLEDEYMLNDGDLYRLGIIRRRAFHH